jgi:hypothetical protein
MVTGYRLRQSWGAMISGAITELVVIAEER